MVWIQKDKELYHPFPTKPLTVSFIHTSSYAGEVEITTELDAEERGIGSDKSDSTRTPRISNPP